MAFLSYYLIIQPAKQAGLPPPLLHKMFLNNVVSVALSYVPSHLLNHVIELTCCCHAIVAGTLTSAITNPQIGSFLSLEISSSAYGKST